MKIRIDYLNKNKEVRHIFIQLYNSYYGCSNTEDIGYELYEIMKQGATDIKIYNITMKTVIEQIYNLK